MPTVSLTIQVPNIDEVIRFYDQIRVYRSVTGETGAYTELTTAGTRLILEAGKTVYDFADRDGNAAYWYRTDFFESASSRASVQSDPIQGILDPAFDIISPQDLRDFYLFGVDLRDERGNLLPDRALQFYIKSAISQAERMLDLPIRRVVTQEITPERQDFFIQEYYKYIRLQLDESPVISVEDIKIVLPTETEVIDFPLDWIQLDKISGQVNIIPGSGNVAVTLLGQSGAWLPLVYGWTDYIPHIFRIAYTAGFEDVPYDIRDVVGKLASFGPLNLAGDLVLGAGIAGQQISLDGISAGIQTTQSATNAGYGARLKQYAEELKVQIPEIRRYYKGVRFQVA